MPGWTRHLATIIVVLLALVVLLGGGAFGTTAQPLLAAAMVATPVPGGPGYVMVPAAAFVPDAPQLVDARYSPDPGYLWTEGASTDPRYHAPLLLPNGVRITGLTVYYYDNDSAALATNVNAVLGNYNFCTGQANMVALTYGNPNAEGSPSIQLASTTTIFQPDVDLRCAAYHLNSYVPKSPEGAQLVRLYAMRVDYSYNTALPAVTR